MDSKSSYSLTEIRDAMRARVPQRVGMGRENVFMTTEYGDVVITDRYVLFPGNPYKFAGRRKSLADYCDFIIGGIEPYSSPDVRIKKVLEEMSGHRYSITAIKVLDIQTEHGRVLVDGGNVRYPGNPECFSRGTMTLQEWCAFVLDGIDKYPGHREDIRFHKTDVGDILKEMSELHTKWVNSVESYGIDVKENSAVLVRWAQLLRELALKYSEMFEADIAEVQVEIMRSVGKYSAAKKTIVLDLNLISWPLRPVQEIILHYICRSFYPKGDVAFWYYLEQMCMAAGLIDSCGKVEGQVDSELFQQVRTQGRVGIRNFVLYGATENLFFVDERVPDIHRDSIFGNDYYYPKHKRLMNQCWEYIIGTGEMWQCILTEADNRRYLLQIGGVGLFGDEYRIYGCSWGQIGSIPVREGVLVGFSDWIIVLRREDVYSFFNPALEKYMQKTVEEVGTIVSVLPDGFVAINDGKALKYDRDGETSM